MPPEEEGGKGRRGSEGGAADVTEGLGRGGAAAAWRESEEEFRRKVVQRGGDERPGRARTHVSGGGHV